MRPQLKTDLKPVSWRSRNVFVPGKSQQNLKPYDYRSVLFTCRLLIWTEVLFIQRLLGGYTSLFLDTDDLKTALRARKVSEAFEKRAPGLHMWWCTHYCLHHAEAVTCCPLPVDSKGLSVEPASCEVTNSSYGAECRFQCASGYRLEGPSIKTCTQSGDWSFPANTYCKGTLCRLNLCS